MKERATCYFNTNHPPCHSCYNILLVCAEQRNTVIQDKRVDGIIRE